MSKRWYGSIDNRIEEGHNFNEDKTIHEGDDINVYYWSDVNCKFVTKVIDQKHIFVHDYEVCADHSKPGGMGHQDWMYFKSIREHNEYLKKYFPDTNTENIHEKSDEEWAFRYGHWNTVVRFNQEDINRIKARDGWCRLHARNEKEQALLDAGKTVTQYFRITEGISIGKDIKRYYHDWEF